MAQTTPWITVGLFCMIGLIFSTIPIVVATFIRPKKATPDKEATYECGLHPKGSPWVQFNIQYYLYALVFLIFDIEILYILPWAVNFRTFPGALPTIEMFIFLTILFVGLVYAWKKGGLEWN